MHFSQYGEAKEILYQYEVPVSTGPTKALWLIHLSCGLPSGHIPFTLRFNILCVSLPFSILSDVQTILIYRVNIKSFPVYD